MLFWIDGIDLHVFLFNNHKDLYQYKVCKTYRYGVYYFYFFIFLLVKIINYMNHRDINNRYKLGHTHHDYGFIIILIILCSLFISKNIKIKMTL